MKHSLMELSPLFTNNLTQDIVATLVTSLLALIWLRTMDTLAHWGLIEQKLSRKLIHIGTGPLFVLCWNLFSEEPQARYLAALTPLMITLQFFAVGSGLIKDPAAVQAMTRNGDPREILRGPLYYGIVFVICTLIFWRSSPVGVLALMLMCGGDGLADIVGRRLGTHKLPFNPNKSWAGSVAMFGGGFGFGFGSLALFNAFGNFQPPLNLLTTAGVVGIIALAATIVEALPFRNIDNLTLTGVAAVLGLGLL